jgi:hypothetical protein
MDKQHFKGLATCDAIISKLNVVKKGAPAAATGVECTVSRAACTLVILLID